ELAGAAPELEHAGPRRDAAAAHEEPAAPVGARATRRRLPPEDGLGVLRGDAAVVRDLATLTLLDRRDRSHPSEVPAPESRQRHDPQHAQPVHQRVDLRLARRARLLRRRNFGELEAAPLGLDEELDDVLEAG